MTTQAPAPAPHEPFTSDTWTPPPSPKYHRRWLLIIRAVIVVLVVGGIINNATKPAASMAGQTTAAAAPVTTTVSITVPVTVTQAAPAPVTVTAAAPDPVTLAPPAAAPGTVPRDGTNLVGTDVQPGTYKSSEASGCYWERLSGTSGSFEDIIANEFSPGGVVVVTIDASDLAFKSQDCAPWVAVG